MAPRLLVVDRSAVIVVDLEGSRRTGGAVYTRFDLPANHDVLGTARFSPSGEAVVVATRSPDPMTTEEFYRVVVIDRSSNGRTVFDVVRAPEESGRFTGTMADPAFDPTGRYLAWAEGMTGTLSVHDLNTGVTEQHPIADPASLITGLSWSPGGLLAIGIDARLVILALGQGDLDVTHPLPDGWSVTAAPPVWSADGSTNGGGRPDPRHSSAAGSRPRGSGAGIDPAAHRAERATAAAHRVPGFPRMAALRPALAGAAQSVRHSAPTISSIASP